MHDPPILSVILYLLTSRFEADPEELVRSVEECIQEVWQENEEVRASGVKCVGIANQRETIVLWDKVTGRPLYNAVGEYSSFFHVHCQTCPFPQCGVTIVRNNLLMNLYSRHQITVKITTG